METPVFIADGQRRRVEMAFAYKKDSLILGFNADKSHDIINIDYCPAMEAQLNDVLPEIKNFLRQLCQIKNRKKVKNKIVTSNIGSGDIFLCGAANGVDILLTVDTELSLEQRMCICDFANGCDAVVRVALRRNSNTAPETIIEKNKPYINIADHRVYLPGGAFLQASVAGEQALINAVMKYLGTTEGKIADLFCGIGTFSYPMSDNIKNKIIAVDCAPELLDSFQKTVNALTIPNIQILKRNLFKYPLDTAELKGFKAIVFDPPRAGASAQIKQITALNQADKPQKIVAVSCNPNTFVNDAGQLLSGGYTLRRITPVDQFVYTNHLELVALFEIKGE